jgi:hypothetical protein
LHEPPAEPPVTVIVAELFVVAPADAVATGLPQPDVVNAPVYPDWLTVKVAATPAPGTVTEVTDARIGCTLTVTEKDVYQFPLSMMYSVHVPEALPVSVTGVNG